MGNSNIEKRFDLIKQYNKMIEQQAGHAVRPIRVNDQFHGDGFINLLNRYGTTQDTTEQYRFQREADVPDDQLTAFYEGNGLFAKIIDTPAEEAVKHGFTMDDMSDPETLDFFYEALDELDWEEAAMTAGRWTRLFGGAIVVMLINDGRGIDEPLDWSNIQSIDDLRVYDRSVITPDTSSMFSYQSNDPFRTRGSRLGTPERYHVYSRYGTFTVHESRCLVFQNGTLPENCTNTDYQLWGMPEYIRIQRAIRDTELAHGSVVKMLDRSVQAVYKMKDLAQLLATDEGESAVLRRLQTIDLARGLLSSITIDNEGEDYDFKQFQFGGVNEVIDSTCNFLSALTSIPQTILFGRSPAGMNATGESDMENFYNYVERIQKRTLRSNLRYLLSVIAQAGMYTGEIKEIPKIKVSFNPLWSMSELEQADLDLKKAQIQQTKASTAQIYVDMQAIDPSEVRNKLAESEDFDVENMLDDMPDSDDDLFAGMEASEEDNPLEGNSSDTAPAATKLPQDMTDEELAQIAQNGAEMDDNEEGTQIPTETVKHGSVGVIVISNGKVLCGTRMNDNSPGTICGPGGHVEEGETPEDAAFRETEEEFGISPTELIPIGYGPTEPGSGLSPCIFLCTEYEGEPDCIDGEISSPRFLTLEEIELLGPSLFQPFKDGLNKVIGCLDDETAVDGGHGSGNFGHEGREGEIGGSAPSSETKISEVVKNKKYLTNGKYYSVEEALSSGKPKIMAAVAKELGAKKSDCQKAVEEGKAEELLKKTSEQFLSDYPKKIKKSMEKKEKELESTSKQDTFVERYEDAPGHLSVGESDTEEQVKSKFGEKQITTQEFYREASKTVKEMDEGDYVLWNEYQGGGGGIVAEKLNEKMRNKENVSQREQYFVDMITQRSKPIEKDCSLFRVVKNTPDISGDTIESKSVVSTSAGKAEFFTGSLMKINAPKGTKAFFSPNGHEGEIVLPKGTKMKYVGTSEEIVPVWSRPDGRSPGHISGHNSVSKLVYNYEIVVDNEDSILKTTKEVYFDRFGFENYSERA